MCTIREATLADEAFLLPLDRATWTSDVSPAPTPSDATRFLTPGIDLADLLVAEDDGVVVGYVRLGQTGPLPSHAHVLTINGLAVDPARQGQGIGRQLVLAALDEAQRRGARKVTLRVLAPNTAARVLYERCGFVVEGVLNEEFLLNGRFVDDLLMRHDLTADGSGSRPPCRQPHA